MRTPISNRQVATSSIPSSHQRRLRLTLVQAALGLVALVFSLPLYARSEPPPATTIIVLVYNYVGVPHSTLVGAEREANRILATAGSQADFLECMEQPVAPSSKDLCQRGWTTQTPGQRFISGSNKFQEAEFAETAIPVLSTIYYEKVARRAHRENADADLPAFLGCVIAHELGHLLLGHPGHSATGIMQPKWGRTQLRQAQTGNLVFTREQATRIRAQDRRLASLRQPSPDTAPTLNDVIPFELRSGFLILVEGRIGPLTPLKFILDTGATHTVVDIRTADKLSLPRQDQKGEVLNFDQHAKVQWTNLPEFAARTATRSRCPCDG